MSNFEITRDSLLQLIASELERQGITVSELEKQADVTQDSVRDFIRGKTYIPRADKLQKILKVIKPDLDIFWHN